MLRDKKTLSVWTEESNGSSSILQSVFPVFSSLSDRRLGIDLGKSGRAWANSSEMSTTDRKVVF